MYSMHDSMIQEYINLGSEECRNLVARCTAEIRRVDTLYAKHPVVSYEDGWARIAAAETLQNIQEAMALAFERDDS